MFRRAFITGSAVALAAAPVLASAQLRTVTRTEPLAASYVTSIEPDALSTIAVGEPVSLVRDPQRRFEPAWAVAVMAGGARLGYLPGTTSKMIVPLLDSEAASVAGTVTRIVPGDRPYIAIDLMIEAA